MGSGGKGGGGVSPEGGGECEGRRQSLPTSSPPSFPSVLEPHWKDLAFNMHCK